MNMIMVWHGLSAHGMESNMQVIMMWAWMLWSPYAVEHERYYGMGIYALVIVWSRFFGAGMDALLTVWSRT